jgi:hypothetical protein
MLRRIGIIAVLSLIVVALTAAVASAAVNFKSGPTCTDQGLTLNCTGNVSGLGQQQLTVNISSPATATTTCTNPGGNVAPGQTFTFQATGTQTVQVDKNGRATFNLTTPTPTPPPGSCPNSMWTASVADVTFGTVTLTGTQGGVIVFSETVTPS